MGVFEAKHISGEEGEERGCGVLGVPGVEGVLEGADIMGWRVGGSGGGVVICTIIAISMGLNFS